MLRRSILQDVVTVDSDPRWTDEELVDFTWWALDQVAVHTAVATATSFSATGAEYDMPGNMLSDEPLDINGVVRLQKTTGDIVYLDPVKYTDGLNLTSRGFYSRGNTLVLTFEPLPGERILVDYYAHYDRPSADDDVVNVPRWLITPLMYLIGAHALAGAGLKTAFIRQWGAKPDTGSPEHNPLKQQQKWFLEMYELEMVKHSPQERTNQHRDAF